MGNIITFFQRYYFRLMVIISIGIILYYMLGRNLIDNAVNKPDSQTSAVINQITPDSEESLSGSQSNNNKTLLINSVKLADQKKEEQTILIEENSNQSGTDVVLVEKNKKANWIFRFSNGQACNGKISIEGFGTIIPATEKQMAISFTPAQDFTIFCDQGKFNYYIKVVDNLNAAFSLNKVSLTNQTSPTTSKPSASKTQPQNPVPQMPADLPPQTTINDEAASIPAEEPKQGFLSHLFHHNH